MPIHHHPHDSNVCFAIKRLKSKSVTKIKKNLGDHRDHVFMVFYSDRKAHKGERPIGMWPQVYLYTDNSLAMRAIDSYAYV